MTMIDRQFIEVRMEYTNAQVNEEHTISCLPRAPTLAYFLFNTITPQALSPDLSTINLFPRAPITWYHSY